MASVVILDSEQTAKSMSEKVRFTEGAETAKRVKSSEGEEKGDLARTRDLMSLWAVSVRL
jgi:hypothetical protein